jgi:hypothetical protein
MNMRLLLGGLKSYLPIGTSSYTGTGGTVGGSYCYSVWLRHLTLICRSVPGFRPRAMAELGPGDSIGVGIAALLTGIDRYVGLDVLEHARVETNMRVLDELVKLFRNRAPIPGDADFPALYPRLSAYGFPGALLDEPTLRKRLSAPYLAQLRDAVAFAGKGDVPVRYVTPWSRESVEPGTLDLVLSHGALQDMDHMASRDDLRSNLEAMVSWLKPGGVMSHHIELRCPGGEAWNHHWAYGDLSWAIVRGKRPYYKNRVPLSRYISLMEAMGCHVSGVQRLEREGLGRDQVSDRFRALPEEDFHTAAALIIAVRR